MIICPLFWILICLTFLFLILFLAVWRDGEAGTLTLGRIGICLVFIIIFGWVFGGHLIPVKKEITDISVSVFKDKNAAYITYNGDVVKTIKNVSEYNKLKENVSIKIKKITALNIYKGLVYQKFEIEEENLEK